MQPCARSKRRYYSAQSWLESFRPGSSLPHHVPRPGPQEQRHAEAIAQPDVDGRPFVQVDLFDYVDTAVAAYCYPLVTRHAQIIVGNQFAAARVRNFARAAVRAASVAVNSSNAPSSLTGVSAKSR